ncbi:MAG: hypothetical protein KGO48_11445 [Alphaproteobacteria bacterium]|nr:hypothetical protein [Alphaproteobacteria bacterium]
MQSVRRRPGQYIRDVDSAMLPELTGQCRTIKGWIELRRIIVDMWQLDRGMHGARIGFSKHLRMRQLTYGQSDFRPVPANLKNFAYAVMIGPEIKGGFEPPFLFVGWGGSLASGFSVWNEPVCFAVNNRP